MRRSLSLALVLALSATLAKGSAAPSPPAPGLGTPQDRSVDPVVLTGAQFPTWSAGPEVSFREPQVPTNYDTGDLQGMLPAQIRSDCYDPEAYPDDPAKGDLNKRQIFRFQAQAE